jgi:mitogen-activated protein kinase 7
MHILICFGGILVDMWSIGCIFAELLGGKPLFKGRDYVDQLNQIISILGNPDDETLSRIGSERVRYVNFCGEAII